MVRWVTINNNIHIKNLKSFSFTPIWEHNPKIWIKLGLALWKKLEGAYGWFKWELDWSFLGLNSSWKEDETHPYPISLDLVVIPKYKGDSYILYRTQLKLCFYQIKIVILQL